MSDIKTALRLAYDDPALRVHDVVLAAAVISTVLFYGIAALFC